MKLVFDLNTKTSLLIRHTVAIHVVSLRDFLHVSVLRIRRPSIRIHNVVKIVWFPKYELNGGASFRWSFGPLSAWPMRRLNSGIRNRHNFLHGAVKSQRPSLPRTPVYKCIHCPKSVRIICWDIFQTRNQTYCAIQPIIWFITVVDGWELNSLQVLVHYCWLRQYCKFQ